MNLDPVRDRWDVTSCCDGLDHPEGVAWWDGRVYCGDEQGRVLRIDPEAGTFEVVTETGGFGQGLAIDGGGRIYFCDSANSTVWRIDQDGTREAFVTEVEGRLILRPNFPVFSADGTLWVSESGTGWTTGDGYVWCKPPGEEPRVVATDCGCFTNGLAIDPGDRELFVIQSTTRPGVVAYELHGHTLGARREVASLPGTVPDGMAFDRDGNLYVACWRPDSIVRIRADGSVDTYVHDPEGIVLKGPTNLAFGGEELGQLYVPEFSGWSMRVLDAEVPGHPLHHPVVP